MDSVAVLAPKKAAASRISYLLVQWDKSGGSCSCGS